MMKFLRKKGGILVPAIFLILVGVLILSRVFKPDSSPAPTGIIQYHEAGEYIGSVMTVCGFVDQATYRPDIGGQPVFLNFGGNAPNHTFNVVIWGRHHSRFPSEPHLLYDNREICVSGRIEEHRDKPQIVVESPNQID